MKPEEGVQMKPSATISAGKNSSGGKSKTFASPLQHWGHVEHVALSWYVLLILQFVCMYLYLLFDLYPAQIPGGSGQFTAS